MNNPKIIIYTVNLGGYDTKHDVPKWKHRDTSNYLYYTDGDAPNGWQRIEIPAGGRRESRFYKINSHLLPPHDISIYVDASYTIHRPLEALANYVEHADIALCRHKHGNIKRHADMVIKLGLGDREIVEAQMQRYGEVTIPLTENGLIIRRNNAKIKELNDRWWAEYQIGSQRDQLSLPYVIQEVKPVVNLLSFSARENKWLTWNPNHLKPRTII